MKVELNKCRNKIKRMLDALEKLGVAGIALGLFQSNETGLILGMVFLALSVLFTREEST